MKKRRTRAAKPARPKRRAQKSGPELAALADIVSGMIEPQIFTSYDADGGGVVHDDSPSGLLLHFLELCGKVDPDSEDQAQALEALVPKLDSLRIDAANGVRAARKERDEVLLLLDQAAEDESLEAADS